MCKLSAVVITLNEERNLARCLSSLKQVANDIVVVDSHSTDATAKIAREFGANFILHKWQGYSRTKNFANTQAKYNWIISLDADEELSQELIASILELKSQKNHQYFYKIHRRANYYGHWVRYSGCQNDIKVRLFDRRKALWKGDYVHEELTFSCPKKISLLKGYCNHYTVCTEEEYLRTIERYSSLGAAQLFEKGRKTNWLAIGLRSVIEFLKKYILKGGFLDGRIGFLISRNSAKAYFLRYYKLRRLRLENS